MAVARLLAKLSIGGESGDFSSDFFNKYATTTYFLSRGAFGNVYGPIQWNKTQLAIKQTLFAVGKVTDQLKKDLEMKKQIWTSFEHRHISKIHSVNLSQLPKVMFVAMEFAAGGSLQAILRSLGSENKLKTDIVEDWATQIAEGMLYLHEKNIVHRDLKSSNILLMEPFDARNPQPTMTLKITDFDEMKEYDHTTTMSNLVGTYAYMAPEVLTNQRFSKVSDVWSFGVVVWEMLSGDIPHKGLGPQEIIHRSMSGNLDNLPIQQSLPESYQLLLRKCWMSDYEERPSFHVICYSIDPMKKYKLDPVLIETITKEPTNRRMMTFTIIDNELFVASRGSSVVEVYDSINFRFSRRWTLEELFDPTDIVSCNRNKYLYISDSKDTGQSSEILRVDANGKFIRKWSTGEDLGLHLSVTDESNVIFTRKKSLCEYSPDGQLIREIDLSDAGIRRLDHAIKLTNGNFVVCHTDDPNDLHRVCIVDADGKLLKSFCGKPGSNTEKMPWPYYLSVDGNGFVLVVAHLIHRVLLLDSDLNFKKKIQSIETHGIKFIKKILLDESNGRFLVAGYDRNNYGRIFIFQL